ncbi:hypothetical protein ONE63_009585 [Megalurothrips usitatus]|uniref:C2H2-type domain-containing protein n=1 Tax=Megalurothrips usitatus TaxID=439358 RepID=A0AAV7XL25_9NEOP|nr:hypothetical protein ONE63_009585 [Megalurothrips usitatus]
MFTCAVGRCDGKVTFSEPNVYSAHLQFYHPKLIRSGPLICTHSSCINREFDKFNSFKKHVRKHQVWEGVSYPFLVENVSEDKVVDQLVEKSTSDTSPFEECVSIAVKNDSLKFDEALCTATIAHISKLYTSGLTETQVQAAIESHSDLLNGTFLQTLKCSVVGLLSKPELADAVSVIEVNNLSRMFDSVINMYDGFHTSYLRLKEYEKCGAFVAPEEFVTGTAMNEVSVNGEIVLVPVTLKGQSIPFRYVLKGFLEQPGTFQKIMDYITALEAASDKGVESVIQCKLWKEKIKPMFVGKIVFPISFNYDDYETGKELGFHAGVHSLGAGYIRLLCLPPEFSSHLQNIFLVLLFYSSDKDFGNKKVFGKVADELLFLEKEGISVVTVNTVYEVHFAFCFAGGDNKGANEMLGYVEGFSGNHYCRMCSSNKQLMCKATRTDPAARRTPDCYDRELKVKNQTLTGRSGECVFNILESYHVYENFYLDIMHDWDEGVWKYLMTDIIRYFIQKKVFSLEYRNELVQSFYYGPNESRNI